MQNKLLQLLTYIYHQWFGKEDRSKQHTVSTKPIFTKYSNHQIRRLAVYGQ